MKRLNGICLLILIYGLFAMLFSAPACNILPNNSGNDLDFEAEIEGKGWKATTTKSQITNEVLTVNGRQEKNEGNYESISISMAEFKGEGSYQIYNNSYGSIIGFDGVALFGFSRDTTGKVTITDFNEASGIVEGEFSFTLTANYDHNNLKNGVPFTITGHFKSQIDTTNQ